MYERVVEKSPSTLFNVLDQCRTHIMCERAVKRSEYAFKNVPGQL